MSLTNQINIYAVDSDAFYTEEERDISIQLNNLRTKKKNLKEEIRIGEQFLSGAIPEKKQATRYREIYRLRRDIEIEPPTQEVLVFISEQVSALTPIITNLKKELKDKLERHNGIRTLDPRALSSRNVISVFESAMTRVFGFEKDCLYDDVIVVRAYYYEVLKDIIEDGFLHNGERYVVFTASAGQIRTKRTVFVKESLLEKHRLSLMCGLTIDRINELGGVNVNKYLAYLALSNSATDIWEGFDIDKSIVVDDFETLVSGTVDYIDGTTYEITRREMGVPITHTDGCGMMLPSISWKNMMVRLPWVKGLLASFDFKKFIREANEREPEINHGLVRDIYGKEWDILRDDIRCIFTKSQFKMQKYYDNWQDYVDKFKHYGCLACKCNEEESFIPNAKLNYQMLQTLTDISDEELRALAEKSVKKLDNISADKDTMLRVFGVKDSNRDKNHFQRCVELYNELLCQEYSKETLKQIKKSLVNDCRAGKIDIDGKYLFIIPDLYAFCEHLFLGIDIPQGLLKDGEVSARVYAGREKLDCLRSPHLYREHGVRRNIVNEDTKKWFRTDALYTSSYDLISKLLQFDKQSQSNLLETAG